MENISISILNDFVNHSYCVNNSFEDEKKVVHLDEFDSDKL